MGFERGCLFDFPTLNIFPTYRRIAFTRTRFDLKKSSRNLVKFRNIYFFISSRRFSNDLWYYIRELRFKIISRIILWKFLSLSKEILSIDLEENVKKIIIIITINKNNVESDREIARIEIQRVDVARTEAKVVQRDENKSEVEMRAPKSGERGTMPQDRGPRPPPVKEQKQLFTALGTRKTS